MSGSWKISLPCTAEEAERIALGTAEIEGFDPPPALIASEAEAGWRIEAHFEREPDAAALAAVAALAPSAAGAEPMVEELPEEDWVTLSQQGLEPIRAGRFFVHTPAHRDAVPDGAAALEIDAGRAFGTGHH